MIFDTYEDVVINELDNWDAHSIFVLKDASDILSVRGLVQEKM